MVRPAINIGECSFKGCERPNKYRGLCVAHYQQSRKGGPLKPLRLKGHAVLEKFCTGCGVVKQRPEFYERGNGGIHTQCKKCMIRSAIARRIAKEKANEDA